MGSDGSSGLSAHGGGAQGRSGGNLGSTTEECTRPSQDPTIDTISGPQDLNCGGYTWQSWWELPQPAGNDGWVIQEVLYTKHVEDASGATIEEETVHYWEAWPVDKGKTISQYQDTGALPAYDDWYGGSPRNNTKGTIVMTGTAKFYEGTLPPDFVPNNPDTYAFDLPATTTEPDFWDGTGTTHNILATWDCTGGNNESTVTAQAGGSLFTAGP